jgi:GntR family transcriptional regulator
LTPTWNQSQPIYRQLADLLAADLLDGQPAEGEAMPSVRALAARYLLNPLTVNVMPGARRRLLAAERERFLSDEWPRLREKLKRLGLGKNDLDWEAH